MKSRDNKNKKVVKASAGTGKTYRLAIEYISRILLGEDYNEILFMTFTRAATAELKVRIFEFLDDLSKGNKELEENIKTLYPEIEIDTGRIKKVKTELLLNKDKIRIYTIDSFIAQIFKKAIGPSLNIYTYSMSNTVEAEEIYGEVFSRIIKGEEFYKVKKFLEKTADREVEKYIDLIKKISEERWKFALIGEKEISDDTESIKAELYRNIVRTFELVDELVTDHGKVYEKVLAKAGKIIEEEFHGVIDDKEKLVTLILEKRKEFLENKIINGTQMGGKAREHIKAQVLEVQNEIHRLLERIIFIEEVVPYEKDILDIEKITRSIYDDIKFREKKFTFSDITNYTSEYMIEEDLDLVKDGIITDNFYEIIGGKISTLFLDEAQDTSVSQWRIIEPIAKGCDNIIIVGDEKQSIYSWRGGDKGLFLSFDRILGAGIESLPTNYRSEKKIIDFVNLFFDHVSKNHHTKDEDDRWEYKEVKCCKKDDKGFMAVMVDSEIHSEIAIDIKERFAVRGEGGVPDYRGIGIVGRKKKDLGKIGDKLKELGVPYIMENSLSIVQHPCVEEILRLFNFFIHNDFMSLLEFFRKTIEVGEEDLKYLLNNRGDILGYLLIESEKTVGEDVEEVIIKENLRIELDRIKKIKKLSYEKMGRGIVEEFNFARIYSATRDIKNINFFLELMEEYDYLSDFMSFLKMNSDSNGLKQVGISELNSVILMTIHGSKGLDFHTEYMFLSDKGSSYKLTGYSDKGMQHKVQLLAKLDENYEYIEDYLFTNSIYNSAIKKTDIYEHSEQIFLDEEINTLYVGMTRPRANLFLCIEPTKTTKKKEEIFVLNNDLIVTPIEKYFNVSRKELLEGGTQMMGKFIPYEEKTESSSRDEIFCIDPNLYIDAVALKTKEKRVEKKEEEDGKTKKNKGSIEHSVEKELKRKSGLAIHYYLENIEYGGKEEEKIAKQLTLNKYSNMLGIERTQKIIERVEKFIPKNPRVFDKRWKIFKELDVLYNGKKKIIDRLNVDEKTKEIIIYDYKSGETMKQSQLDEYEEIIREKVGVEYSIKSEFLKLD
ncbi:UvrD-helicase domain-containing protein [Psychrilyobacter atlanticus]|uniref:UvrD-helicase domain-containing protein n=1 Tax=Psychrilyobacter atlanticus TaxID=271091 RepID=UPI000400E566|nr:UvrD-helicase domain-containing protein [Psychrilyobacter atlanticus]